MTLDLTALLDEQRELDRYIFDCAGTTREATADRRLLALFVEVGELANATRCFKFWSRKSPESPERILDEYADVLHFFLSLFIDLNLAPTAELPAVPPDLTAALLQLEASLGAYAAQRQPAALSSAFAQFAALGAALGLSQEQIEGGYRRKKDENRRRQQTGY